MDDKKQSLAGESAMQEMLRQSDTMREMEASVARVAGFFKKGTLQGKEDEANALLQKGDTAFFDGEVFWGITIPYDRNFNGYSESMDHAIVDIRNCLMWLKDDIYKGDGGTEVICYLKTGPESTGGVHE